MSNNWLTDTIALETKYDEGYEAGKQAAAEELLNVLEEIKTKCVDSDGHFLYGVFMNLCLDIKKKYMVN